MEIVSVKFQDRLNKSEYTGREYSYYAGIPLEVGDIVAVPTQKGMGTAQVTRTNVPVSEIRFDLSKLKTIDSFAPQHPECLARGVQGNDSSGTTEQLAVPAF